MQTGSADEPAAWDDSGIAIYYWKQPISRDLIELRNLTLAADMTVRSAQLHRESLGLNNSADYPETPANAKDTILVTDQLS